MIRRDPLLSLLVTLLALSGGALSAREPAPPSPVFEDELSVEVINVEVYITDRKGRPVTGLAREVFQLFEDGDPVEIAYFSAFEGERRVAHGPTAGADPAAGAEAAPAQETTNLLIYLDDANMERGGRRRALRDLRDFVAGGRDGADRLMVVAHDAGLRIVQPFTEDRQAVLAALEELEARATGGTFRTLERTSVMQAIEEVHRFYTETRTCAGDPCHCGWDKMEALARQYADTVAGHVREAAAALSELASALSGVSGRKLVLYVADGLEQRAGIDIFHYAAGICPQYDYEYSKNFLAYDQAPVFNRLTAHANGITFYTLEALGLQTDATVTETDPDFRVSRVLSR